MIVLLESYAYMVTHGILVATFSLPKIKLDSSCLKLDSSCLVPSFLPPCESEHLFVFLP
jgi:hypothetical protein